MASEPVRDPVKDHLLTPQNAAFILIDYQPVQVNSIASMERQRLVSNITRAAKAARNSALARNAAPEAVMMRSSGPLMRIRSTSERSTVRVTRASEPPIASISSGDIFSAFATSPTTSTCAIEPSASTPRVSQITIFMATT